VDLITAGIWGNTVFDAASAAVCDQAERATELPPLTALVSRVLLADLPAALWAVLDGWVTGLAGETFIALLPLLRRTFATFAPAERRLMGEQAADRGRAAAPTAAAHGAGELDVARAEAVLPLLARLLGLEPVND
jgi:hypothetical protein